MLIDCYSHVTEVGWFNILPPRVGWYIMGYESEPLPSFPELINCSHSVKLIIPPTHLLFRFIYRVLIPPLHHPDCTRHPLRLCEQFIDMVAGHPLRYVCLSPLNLHPYWVNPRGFHCLYYQGVLSLSVGPAFRHHACDPSRRPMVEPRQDLKHLRGHHPALAAI